MTIRIDIKTAQEILGDTGTYADNGDGFVGRGDTIVKKTFSEDLSVTTKAYAIGEKGTDLTALAADLSEITGRKMSVTQEAMEGSVYLFVDQKVGIDEYRAYELGSYSSSRKEAQEDSVDKNKLDFFKEGPQAPALDSKVLGGIKKNPYFNCQVDKKNKIDAACAQSELGLQVGILNKAQETQEALMAEKAFLESALEAWGQGAMPTAADLTTISDNHFAVTYLNRILEERIAVYLKIASLESALADKQK